MNITEVRVHCVDQAQVRAYVKIVFDNCFAVNELRIIQTHTGFMVAMPSEKQKNGDYADLAFPINAVTRKMIEDAVIGEYLRLARESQPNRQPMSSHGKLDRNSSTRVTAF